MNTIQSYYDANTQYEWERFDRHRTEFAITKRALAEYLPPPPARILDCGGGPGRYAIYLAGQGYQVTLLDLSSNNLAMAEDKAREAGVHVAGFVHGDARDLSRFDGGAFDAVLLFGPLYHLLTDDDRMRALAEARRVLRHGGPLFAAFITLYAPLRDAIAKGYLKQYSDRRETVRQLLESQVLNAGFTDAWFTHPDQVRPLMESSGLRTLALLAAEGLAAGHEQHLNALDEASFAFWTEINYRLAADVHLLGAADHLLYIGLNDGPEVPPSSDRPQG